MANKKKDKTEKIPPLPELPEYEDEGPSDFFDYADRLASDPDVSQAFEETYIDWINTFKDCFEANRKMFKTTLKGFMKPFWLSIGMNVAIFILGISAFSIGMIVSVLNDEYLFALVFGGVDAITFLTFFMSNPIKNLEKDMGFITWLGLIYNTYWTRAYYSTNSGTFQKDLQEITDKAVDSLQKLLDTQNELGKFQLPDLKLQGKQSSTKNNKATTQET